MRDLHLVSQRLHKKLLPIKVILVDVDGVLTDGRLFYMGNEVGFNRFFHAHDGYIIKVLLDAGLKVGIISGGDSVGLRQRLGHFKFSYIFLGSEDKRDAYLQVRADGYRDEEILYMGDEFFDLPLLKKAGFAATVPDAGMEIRQVCDYVTERRGGEGAFREVADLVRYAQGIVPVIPDFERECPL